MAVQSYSVLLVEDSHDLREAVQISLEDLGYIVHGAADGKEALRLFQEKPVDVALLDIQLPGMDGFTLCRELRKDRAVPVVFVSAGYRADEVHGAAKSGAVDFLRKPFDLLDMDQKIQKVLLQGMAGASKLC
jgi:CheY-like chemotaxis protein